MARELPKIYDPSEVESSIYNMWESNGYFHAERDENKKPYTIVMPPPNVTGQLHMGHAVDNTMQDIPSEDLHLGRHYHGSARHLYPADQRYRL